MGISPVGTVEESELRGPSDLIPQVPIVIFHAVLFEKLQILFLKRFFPVVCFLVVDVGDGFVQLRHADRERAVTFLPREIPLVGKRFMNPQRRTTLDHLCRLRQRNSGRQRKQNMHMVIRAADGHSLHLVFAGDAAKVSPKPQSDFGCDETSPLFGAENVMDVTTDIGVGHDAGLSQPSLRD